MTAETTADRSGAQPSQLQFFHELAIHRTLDADSEAEPLEHKQQHHALSHNQIMTVIPDENVDTTQRTVQHRFRWMWRV